MSELLTSVLEILSDATWRHWLGGVLCLIGGVMTVIAAVGVIRFPDFYTRLHAASVTDSLGALTLLFGMMFLATGFPVVVKLFLIALFLVLTGPTSAHAIANAAYTAGLEPLAVRSRLKPPSPIRRSNCAAASRKGCASSASRLALKEKLGVLLRALMTATASPVPPYSWKRLRRAVMRP